MVKVITLNVNGLRSAAKKGFFAWAKKQDADFICLQEIKAKTHQVSSDEFLLPGYEAYFAEAEKPGYSGVAIYSKHKPLDVIRGLGWEIADTEGRYLQLNFKKFSIASLYLPSGTSGEIRQQVKFDFLDRYEAILQKQRAQNKSFILCGDWNIAHKNIDLKNWKSNQKNSGFLPEERAWLDHLFNDLHYVDAFRVLNQEPEQYTWWSARGRAYEKNVGWRIDYQIVTPDLKDAIKNVAIYTEERFSDHAPLIIDYFCEMS